MRIHPNTQVVLAFMKKFGKKNLATEKRKEQNTFPSLFRAGHV